LTKRYKLKNNLNTPGIEKKSYILMVNFFRNEINKKKKGGTFVRGYIIVSQELYV
jgi:hypothetical protein